MRQLLRNFANPVIAEKLVSIIEYLLQENADPFQEAMHSE